MKKLLTSKLFWGIVILLVIGGVLYSRSRNVANGKETPYVPQKDEIVKPERRDLQQVLTLSGAIDAEKKAEVRFQTSGMLTWVGVKEGSQVKKWQALASLDRKELAKRLEQEYNDYRTSLSQFQDTQDEYKTIRENNNLTDEMKRILERSQFSLNNSVVSYELADLAIKYATVTSPISGIVTEVDQPNPGVNITPATASFTIIDPTSLYFNSEVEQEDVTKIIPGKTAIINLDSFPDQTIESVIDHISFAPIAGKSSTVYQVKLKLPVNNEELQYRLGMDGDAIINLAESKNTLVLPIEAIIEEDDKRYVLVKSPDSNATTQKEVKVGLETDNEVEILEGITLDDQVIIKNQ